MAILGHGALSPSKAALDAVSTALRTELQHQGVGVSYVEPGGLDTSFFATAVDARRRDGWAGSVETQSRYEGAVEAAAQALAGTRTTPVRHAVRAIERALTARRPAARYVVGRDARLALPVLRLLPTGLRDRLVLASLGLGKDAFPAR